MILLYLIKHANGEYMLHTLIIRVPIVRLYFFKQLNSSSFFFPVLVKKE